LIGHTTTAKGLKIHAAIDASSYPKGQTVSDEAMQRVHLKPDAFHGEWNYAILPGASA
jgi:Rhodopirellula transposase DDE domain